MMVETGKLYESCWREFSEEEEKNRMEYRQTRLADFFKICKLLNVETVLDAGCGSGINCNIIRENGFETTGFDLNPAVAKERVKGIEIFQGNLEALPFENKFFDAVVSMNVVMCTDETKTVTELLRVTGKVLFISLYGELGFFQNCFEKGVRFACRFVPFVLSKKVLRLLFVNPILRSVILDNAYVARQERYSEKRVLELLGNGFFCIFRRYGNLVSCIAIRKSVLYEGLKTK